jgi:hypothetical protein
MCGPAWVSFFLLSYTKNGWRFRKCEDRKWLVEAAIYLARPTITSPTRQAKQRPMKDAPANVQLKLLGNIVAPVTLIAL